MDEAFPESLIRRFAAGEYIFREGDAGRHMYAVRSGSVEFRKTVPGGEPRVLQRVGPGGVFGEVALVEDVPRSADAITVGEMGMYRLRDRSATVTAGEPSSVLRMSDHTMRRIEARSPELALGLHKLFVRLLASRLEHSNAQLKALSS